MELVYKTQKNLGIELHFYHRLLFKNMPNLTFLWNKNREFMFGNAKL